MYTVKMIVLCILRNLTYWGEAYTEITAEIYQTNIIPSTIVNTYIKQSIQNIFPHKNSIHSTLKAACMTMYACMAMHAYTSGIASCCSRNNYMLCLRGWGWGRRGHAPPSLLFIYYFLSRHCFYGNEVWILKLFG